MSAKILIEADSWDAAYIIACVEILENGGRDLSGVSQKILPQLLHSLSDNLRSSAALWKDAETLDVDYLASLGWDFFDMALVDFLVNNADDPQVPDEYVEKYKTLAKDWRRRTGTDHSQARGNE